MRTGVLALTLMFGACFDPSYNNPTCGPAGQCPGNLECNASNVCVGSLTGDGGMSMDGDGATSDSTDALVCLGGPLQICLTSIPSGPRTLPSSISTGNMPNCDLIVPQTPGFPDLCVITGAQITISGSRGDGSRPLVIVATDSITITGTLDVSSPRIGGIGAGSSTSTVAPGGSSHNGGASGGGGGGFGSPGSAGGRSDLDGTTTAGGPGGAAITPTALRGGSRGGNGGAGASGGMGAGGYGGGVAYLIARNSITLTSTGRVYASGAGGTAGLTVDGGGGGGGSGGLLGFDAPTITNAGLIGANGGGGGSGAGTTAGAHGEGGVSANGGAWDVQAMGGSSGGAGGSDGGRGGTVLSATGGLGQDSTGGSGGGGGGVGIIWVHGGTLGGKVSPAPTPH